MDPEKARRRQSLKVLLSEAVMVLTVIITVVILAFVVSGYWVNSDFKVERQGMLQISSTPTGASVSIDGDSSWFQRTNTSKVLASGEHAVSLTKEGYDSWEKTIDISEGLLYRISYPRLFLKDRTAEKVLSVPDATIATVSPNRNLALLINGTTEWSLVNLDSDKPEAKPVDISAAFSTTSLAEGAKVGLFTGEILSCSWDHDSRHVLFHVKSSDSSEWVLLDVKTPTSSINITKEFNSNFSDVQILDNSATTLLAVKDGNLHRIDLSGKLLSAILVENIVSFDHYDDEVVFAARRPSSSTPDETEAASSSALSEYYIGLLKSDTAKPTPLGPFSTPPLVALSKFYDEKYITVLTDTIATLYHKADFEPSKEYQLAFAPSEIKVGHDGDFIAMSAGSQTLAVIDMEASQATEWQVEGDSYGWLDGYMVYTVANGELIVYDFDGLNRRALSQNVSSRFPVTISNDRWLYYFSDDYLVREEIKD